ncbi:hypothetical protein ABFS82_14G071000 [Erythranthe guttata]
MGVKVAAASLHWSQPSVPHSPSSSQSLPSAVSSNRRGFLTGSGDGALFCQYVERSAALSSKLLHRSQSCGGGGSKTTRVRTIRRAISASLDNSFSSDEEFSKQIQELALRFQLSDNDMFMEKPDAFDPLKPCPDFPERDEITPSSNNIEWRANSFDIPLSLRIIKRKKQWLQSGFAEAGESACCSVKKAFSSMVFIIQELHSFTLQMREVLFYEDLQGILANVQKEMQASFVWLFQKVFSHTPTLMVYVMILLANYSVHSISSNSAFAAVAAPLQTYSVEEVSMAEDQTHHKFDSSIVRTMKLSLNSNSNEDEISVGGNSGGGRGKYPTVASGTDGDGTTNPNGALSSSILNPSRTSGGEELVSRQVSVDEETDLWNSMVDEASKMEAESRDEALDHETMQRFVSPVNAIIQDDDYSDHFRTELLYQSELAQEPNNPLLLANYAQFLYLVVHDFDRAEDYFKRATKVEPKDGEALNKYANFLWLVRKDLWAAEETYLEAISAEQNNSYYAANYAHFLWSTGGEETCFPIDSTDSSIEL